MKLDKYSLRFYSSIAPSIIFPLAFGISDGLGSPIGHPALRQGIYAGGVMMHLGKYTCPPAFSDPIENLNGGIIATAAFYWIGRGIETLVDKLK